MKTIRICAIGLSVAAFATIAGLGAYSATPQVPPPKPVAAAAKPTTPPKPPQPQMVLKCPPKVLVDLIDAEIFMAELTGHPPDHDTWDKERGTFPQKVQSQCKTEPLAQAQAEVRAEQAAAAKK